MSDLHLLHQYHSPTRPGRVGAGALSGGRRRESGRGREAGSYLDKTAKLALKPRVSIVKVRRQNHKTSFEVQCHINLLPTCYLTGKKSQIC